MPMKKFQHIRVTAFREPLRTYERDMKGIEEHPIQSTGTAWKVREIGINRDYSAIATKLGVARMAE
jgi:hypothetical protein